MDEVFESFVTPATIFVCLAAYVVTYILRTLVEGLLPKAKENHYWRELGLPLGPILVGGAMGFMAKTFVWPEHVSHTLAGRIFYGSICGMFSAYLYSRIRSWLSSKAENSRDEESLPARAGKVGGPKGGAGEEDSAA